MVNCSIEIPVFFLTANATVLQDLDMEVSESDWEPRNMTFYHIGGIAPWESKKGNWYTSILCNNSEYITPMPYQEVKKLIESQ